MCGKWRQHADTGLVKPEGIEVHRPRPDTGDTEEPDTEGQDTEGQDTEGTPRD